MDDVRTKAKELAEALENSDEYKKYKEAREKINDSSTASKMLKDFNKKQGELRQAQMKGEEVSDSKIAELRKTYEIINYNPYIREYFAAEMKFIQLMGEIQDTLGKVVDSDMPGLDDDDASDEDSSETTEQSRIQVVKGFNDVKKEE